MLSLIISLVQIKAMQKSFSFLLFILIFFGFRSEFIAQQKNEKIRILIIFDASNSMHNPYKQSTRIDVAKNMLYQFVDSLKKIDNLELALRVYGHQNQFPPQVCSDTKLEIPFALRNHESIKKKVREISPKGTTPIAESLILAADDFPKTNQKTKDILILITDGVEECGGNLCDAAEFLKKKGINFRPLIIGVGLSNIESSAFNCVGAYFDMIDPNIFVEVYNIIIQHTMYKTTVQVNLMSENNLPQETDLNMSFYNFYNKKLNYNLIHTFNNQGNPDTLDIETSAKYNLVVHTIPEVKKDSLNFDAGRHNIVAVNTPQGKLNIIQTNAKDQKTNINCVIRDAQNDKTYYVQNLNSSQKYLTGKYHVEVLTLPRMTFNNVSIYQSKETVLEIPQSGLLSLSLPEAGVLSVYRKDKRKQEWVCNLKDNVLRQEINLLPGKYLVVFRPHSKKQTFYTQEREFIINSGKQTNLLLK
jgi:Ca-activated chloride channel homolog